MDNISAIVEYEYAAKESDELDLHKGAIVQRIKQLPGGWWEGTIKATGKTGMFPDNFVRLLEPSNSNGSNGNHSDDSAAVQLREKSATSNRRCKVIYSYTQVNDDELTLAVGDVIEFLGEVEEGWWRGRLRTKTGVFPSNFVQHIEPSPILASKRPPTIGATVTTSSLTAKAANIAASSASAAPATATAPAATAKQANRAVTTSNQLTTDGSGAADPPAAAPAPILPPKPQRDFCRVEFPYAPQNEDELELKVDDIITVVNMDLPDKGWWKGELRGKVGVFPDNFVKLLAPSEAPRFRPQPPPRPLPRRGAAAAAASTAAKRGGGLSGQRSGSGGGGSFEFLGARMASFITTIFAPLNEPPQQAQRTASLKPSNTLANATSHMTNTTTQQQSSSQSHSQSSASTTSKVYIKKTGSSSNSTQGSSRKDSFGSRDSLNDILSETGLPTGNVAAQRKSLENKNLDLTNAIKKQQQSNTTITTTTTSSATSSSGMASSELRKSLDSLDDKTKSPPPPVLSKKPSVPLKKTPTTGKSPRVSSNLRGSGGFGALSHDLADGIGSSKLSPSQLPEAGASGNVVMRRAATIAVEDTDFDRVERASILTDMRQGRVKAPKRRPPSAAINVLGESNNNSVYVNGSGMASSASELSEDAGKHATASSDDNSTGEGEQLAKPKPREWEKKKAPWMEELKASQVKKKTSPSVEPRNTTMAERTSKLFVGDATTTSSSSSATSSTTKVQSSAVTSSSIMQQSMYVESSHKKESATSSTSTSLTTVASSNTSSITNDAAMSKSMSAKAATASSDEESRVTRPTSLSIRNRSISPLVKTTNVASSTQSQATEVAAASSSGSSGMSNPSPAPAAATKAATSTAALTAASTAATTASAALLNNHHAAAGGDATRVVELERRVDKLESVVLVQQRSIEELVRALREETDRVKLLRGELDKYAQCVTQV